MIQVAGTLIIQGDEYVLQHRDDIPTIASPGAYSLWAGTLEGEESPGQCAAREVLEETDVVVTPDQLTPLHDYISTGMGPKSLGKPVHIYLFAIEVGPETEVRCNEGQGIIRLPKYAAPHTKLNDFTKQAIEIYEATAR